MKHLNNIIVLLLVASCLGCATTPRIDVRRAISQSKDVFQDQKFAFIGLGTDSKGLIADMTANVCIRSKTSAWEKNCQQLADAIKAEVSKSGNFGVTGANNSKTVLLIKRAFELCQGTDLGKLKVVFVGSAELQAEIRSIVEKSGATFLFREYKPSLTLRSNRPTLCIGTYQKGNNITEPRPTRSQYFKTSIGGFQIIQGLAGYKVFIDVVKHPEKRCYTRAILENPENTKAPFVYDHYIDPSTPSTTLTHGPVKGLQVYKDYKVEFIMYEDEARTKEIDHLTQEIRSYVDTTGEELKLFRRLETKISQQSSAGDSSMTREAQVSEPPEK